MNPAARLLAVYDALVSQQRDTPLTSVWAEVFGLEASSPTLEDDATACVLALRNQIELARLQLAAEGVPAELTSPGFDRLKDVALPGRMHTSWHGVRGNLLAPECRHAFMWAAWVLRANDEDELPPEGTTELRAEIAALESALQDVEMSPYLRDFVQRQLDTIRAALRDCRVQGARPLREALRKVVGDITVEGTQLQQADAAAPAEAKALLARAAGLIEKTAKVCDSVDKIGKFGANVWTLAVTATSFVTSATHLLKGP